jgi:DNA-binding NarL/FixJ family response regulator
VARDSGVTRIAIIDAQQMLLEGLQLWVEAIRPEFEVAMTCASYEDFLDRYAASGEDGHGDGDVDVVVLDVDLADTDLAGDRVGELARSGLRVVAMSTFSDSRLVRHVLASGAAGYVSKQESAVEIGHAVEAAVEGREYFTPGVSAILLEDAGARSPRLSAQETRVMVLYSTGLPLKTVASQMGISQDTVRTYLKRIKAKYVEVGIQLNSKIDFYVNASSLSR